MKLGGMLPVWAIDRADRVVDFLDTGRWMKANHMEDTPWLARREDMWTEIAAEIGDRNTLYLEFGVFRGQSIHFWSGLLRNPACHLHGFDSFRGLPENWKTVMPAGSLSVDGMLPKIEDPRITFYPGWFEETLPNYSPADHEVMIVNIDADLYSSTIYVLRQIESWFRRGDYLYLDDLFDRYHVRRALDEFRQDSDVILTPRSFGFGSGVFQVSCTRRRGSVRHGGSNSA